MAQRQREREEVGAKTCEVAKSFIRFQHLSLRERAELSEGLN